MNDNDMMVMPVEQNELMSFDYDNILAIAERADRMVTALNKIMSAALKITTPKDWVLIGGTPYLQESGATKVARLFGISWQILNQNSERDAEGYPTYHYRMTFSMGNQRIECDGSRNSRDDFFGKGKKVDEIPLEDVRRAAYTNCLNNGIKRILPGLRNLDVSDLEAAGINMNNTRGYTFKEGNKGGAGKSAANSGLKCSNCDAAITQAEASFSEGKWQRQLCRPCQDKAKKGELAPTTQSAPPPDDDELSFK